MINHFYTCFVSVLFLLISTGVESQQHRFRHLSVDDGLSHNGVFCITQDEKGFMWMGTESGLNRYDGNSIKIYRHDEKDKNTLSSDDVNGLLAYKNHLYIGTYTGGLNRMELDKNKIFRYETDKKGNGKMNTDFIQSMILSPDKKIYVGTIDGGINIIDPESGKISYICNDSLHPNVLPSNWVKSMAFDRNGNLWMSHPRTGISQYNLKTGKWKLFTDTTSSIGKLNNNAVRQLYCDSHNRIWISTWSGGFNVYDVNQQKMYSNSITKADPYFKPFMNDPSNASLRHGNDEEEKKFQKLHLLRMIFGFAEDKYGNMWIVTVEEGLFCYHEKTEKLRQLKNNPSDASSLCDNNLLSIFIDKSGLIWTGSLSAGLNIYNPYTDRFGYYKADPENPFGLPNNQVWSIHTGKKTGKIFIGLTGYVYEFIPDENKFINYIVDKEGKSLLHDQSLCQEIYEDHLGNLWVAVNGSGVYEYNVAEKKLTNYNKRQDLGNLLHHTVNSITEDSKGSIWLGMSQHGINAYDRKTKTFRSYTHDGGKKGTLSGYIIQTMLMDKNDRLWIATDSGLNVLNTQTGHIDYYYESNSGLNNNTIYSLYNDKNAFIYIGTDGALCRYNFSSGKIENLTAKYKIAPEGAGGITIDQRGNIWIQPSKGITKIDGKTYQSRQFEFSDGLQSNEFPSNIVQTLPTGQIIFGGNKGLNIFHPDDIIFNKNAPATVITRFLLRNIPQEFDTDISFLNSIELNYDHYFFTVELAALDYTNISKNKFKYKLEGFSDEWVEIGNNRQITFVNLAPGEYTLYVLSCNNDGEWSTKPAILKITITPPFWKTMWFYALCIITVVLLIYGYIKYREKKLRKEKAVLEQKVDLRTSELREEKEKVEEAHKEIRDSIGYAKRLQEAILPPQKMIDRYLPENFVLYKPKDIVAGDFYWVETVGEWLFIASADCTGHGVPGAMVSVVCSNALNRSVKEFGITDTGKILDKTTDLVLETFSKSDADVKDGMDISLLAVNQKSHEIYWSGANNPLWFTAGNGMNEIKADKQPIGKSDKRIPFTAHQIRIEKGEMIYLFTDGYADQFGGEKGKKFKYKPFLELLLQISSKPVNEQKQILDRTIELWKGSIEQNDDICIIGIRL